MFEIETKNLKISDELKRKNKNAWKKVDKSDVFTKESLIRLQDKMRTY